MMEIKTRDQLEKEYKETKENIRWEYKKMEIVGFVIGFIVFLLLIGSR